MERLANMYVKARERFVRFHRSQSRAQTMTEYALVLAAIAVAVYAAYQTLGSSISKLTSGVDSSLTGA